MSNSPLDLMVDKLGTRVFLSDVDRSAVLALPYVLRSYPASAYLVREGEPPRDHCDYIQEGFAYRQKLTTSGGRQIVSIHLRGDFLDHQQLHLDFADHNVQALTELAIVAVDREALQTLAQERPTVGKAMRINTLIEVSIYREWLVNVGRRDGRARIAHVLCEFALRIKAAGLPSDDGCKLPLTQEQLSDVVGLTPVHVSRMLKSLEKDGIVHRAKRHVQLRNFEAAAAVAGFSPLYLHLEQAAVT